MVDRKYLVFSSSTARLEMSMVLLCFHEIPRTTCGAGAYIGVSNPSIQTVRNLEPTTSKLRTRPLLLPFSHRFVEAMRQLVLDALGLVVLNRL